MARKYYLGLDMGIVMAKGVLLGVIGCVTILPSLILLLDKPLQRTKHRSLIPDMGGFAKAVKDRKTEYDWLSYNEENVQAYINDPWCGHWNTGGFWKEFLGGLSKIWDKKEMEKISKEESTLIIAGEDDPVGRMGKGPSWLYNRYKKLGLSDVTLKIYSRMRHEILNETDRERVYRDILEFITRKSV